EGENDLPDHHTEQDRVDHTEAEPDPRGPRPAHLFRHRRGRICTGFDDRRIDGTHTAPHSPGRLRPHTRSPAGHHLEPRPPRGPAASVTTPIRNPPEAGFSPRARPPVRLW